MPARKPITMEAVLVEPQEREFWTLRSLPPYETFTGPEYFYDGELPVVNGRIQVPVSQPTWVYRLLMSNYTFDPPEDEIDFRKKHPEA